MAALVRSEGTTVFEENIFENRYRHVDELIRMGADIRVSGRTAVVTGVEQLSGAAVRCTDLRGGAALCVAALAAEGETRLFETKHIDRGYEDIGPGSAGTGRPDLQNGRNELRSTAWHDADIPTESAGGEALASSIKCCPCW